ncbi:MAG: energy transducer TonB [Bacteroidota bacterium]
MSWIEKKSGTDLRNHYTHLFEASLALALLLMLTAFKVDLRVQEPDQLMVEDQTLVHIDDIVQTKQQEKPPVPPRPEVPAEDPDLDVIEEEDYDFSSDLDLGDQLELPEDPPATTEESEPAPFLAVEKMPQLQGGLSELHKNIQYPDIARKAGIEGKVIIQFVVDEQGKVTQAKVLRGIGAQCDQEALRVLKQAQFTPGIQRGVPVKVKMTLPVIFKLQH